MSWPCGMAGAVGGTVTVKLSPGLTRWLASFTVAEPSATAPLSSNGGRREREKSGKVAARKRSNRQPAWSSPASAVCRSSRECSVSDMPPSSSHPGPENQTPAYKAAKLAVIILSALIILAVIALVVGGITHLGRKAP